jgi:putative hydrolase of the HAD superfamily
MILLIDADDTLWENNIYFERVIDRFVARLDHPHLTHAEVRNVINEVESVNAKVHGYGTASFTRNLRQVFQRLASASTDRDGDQDGQWINDLGRTITDHPIEVIEGVRETLEYLHPRHRLVLFTKGDRAEQLSKVERSGLGPLFHDTRVVREKDAATYESMAAELAQPKDEMWMVGNSPRSDINPALAAGLRAVWIPHDATWVLEHEEVTAAPGRLLTVARFAELRDWF